MQAIFVGILTAILVGILMGAAVYAQYQIPRFAKSSTRVWTARLLLIVVGIAFGLVISSSMQDGQLLRLVAFLTGFGSVHVPAAAILFLKAKRAEGKS